MLSNSKVIEKFAVLFCIAALTGFAGIAQADGRECSGDHFESHRPHNFNRIAKKLGLTEAQKAQVKAIFEANKEVVKPILGNLMAEQKNLRALLHSDPVDEQAIRAETAKLSIIQADLNVNRAKVEAQFRAILTPGQKATLKTLHKKRQQKEDGTEPSVK